MSIGSYKLSRRAAAAEARHSGAAFARPMAMSGQPATVTPEGFATEGGFSVINLLGSRSLGLAMSEADALSTPAALRALEVLCGLFAMAPMVYYRREGDGKVRADDAPQAAMFRTSANAAQSAYLLKEVMLGDLLMRGKFGAYIHRDPLYRASSMTRLDPAGISPPLQHWSKADGLELFYDARLPDRSYERLTRNDLWFVPGFSRDGLCGVERLKLLRGTFEAAAATSSFAARFWENNAQPSTILTTKAKVDAESKAQIKSDWQTRFSGPHNAGSVAVLDQEMSAEFLAHNNQQSQYIETRSFYVVEIARAFGVPPHVLYELSRATFSNIEQQSLELILYSMMSHFERVAAAATHQFAEPGHFYEFLVDALLKGDIKSRYEAYQIAIEEGVLNPNEARRRENMNDREGGDQYRMGSGSTIEGQASPTPANAPRAP